MQNEKFLIFTNNYGNIYSSNSAIVNQALQVKQNDII